LESNDKAPEFFWLKFSPLPGGKNISICDKTIRGLFFSHGGPEGAGVDKNKPLLVFSANT